MIMIIIIIDSIYLVLTVCQFLFFRPFMQNQESRFFGMLPEAFKKGRLRWVFQTIFGPHRIHVDVGCFCV